MKKIIFALLLVSICQNVVLAQFLQGKKAESKITEAKALRIRKSDNIPTYIHFHESRKLDIDNIESYIQKLYSNKSLGLKQTHVVMDKLQQKHVHYQATLNEVPIAFSRYVAHSSNNKVNTLNGSIPEDLKPINQIKITESEALEFALNHINAKTYKWEIESEEAFKKQLEKNNKASYFPSGELVLLPSQFKTNNSALNYTYKFDIYAHNPLSRNHVYVDAENGEILFKNKQIHHTDYNAMATTAYSGTQTIKTSTVQGNYVLRESSRGNGIETYDMNMTTYYSDAEDFVDDNNNWNNVNNELDQYATDAHWAAEMTYDYYNLQHNRNSIDNNGFALRSYVHFNLTDLGYPNNINAFWDGEKMSYGDGDDEQNILPLTTLDISGHEITHGLTSFTADLIYQNEPGALNEAFSDIFGTAIEFYARPGNADWLCGEEIGMAFRSLSNPNEYEQPDTYFGNFWQNGSSDNGGVHTNSGVLNHWFYLTCMGGNGSNDLGNYYSINGIGMTKAEQIAFRMLTVYLTPTSQYQDACFYAKQSAIDLYGTCSQELEAVSNAMYAIGLSDEYVPNVVADFTANQTSSCAVPFTVQFENQSHNGISYQWNFGDGSTSTETNPEHTYTTAGNYSIQLNAYGGSCGSNSISKNNFIVVDPSLDCPVILGVDEISPTQTACSGIIYDNGGPDQPYSNFCNAQITIDPSNGSNVKLTFNEFDVEGSGGSCAYDRLWVIDGPSIEDNIIGYYCNDIPPSEITSTNGAITLVFYSDNVVVNNGFEITWSCTQGTSSTKPIANFSYDTYNACKGDIQFNDNSMNTPTSWKWDFGDGNISHQQNPMHTYNSSGYYNVKLIASNIYGRDTIEKNNVFVDLLDNITVYNDTVCRYESATLRADANGYIEWYDAPVNGNLLKTGEYFQTPSITSSKAYFAQYSTDGACFSQRHQVVAYVDACLGLDENSTTALWNVYPNPAKDELHVNLNKISNAIVQIISLEGKIMYSKTINESQVSIPLNEIPSGLYFCKFTSEDQTGIIKVVIDK